MKTNVVEPLEFTEAPSRRDGPGVVQRDIAMLEHVPVELEVMVGSAVTTVGEFFALRQGSLLELDTELESTVRLRLNGKTVALGHLVASGEHFGIKITEIA